MALRLMLVGVVAGLGLTFPTGKQIDGWKQAAEAWVNTRLAEWDAQMPADESAFVYVTEPTSAVAEAPKTPADESPKTVAPASPVVATPTPAQGDLATGLDIPTVPMDLETPVTVPVISDAAFDAAVGDVLSAFAADQPAITQPAALLAAVEPTDAAFNAAVSDVLSAFAADQPAATQPTAVLAVAEPAESLPLYLNDSFDFLGQVPVVVAEAETAKGADAILPDPFEFDEDYGVGAAYALDRLIEGLEPVARQDELKDSGKDTRLTQAVRLTREAVFAWANLLHGPAVVTIAH